MDAKLNGLTVCENIKVTYFYHYVPLTLTDFFYWQFEAMWIELPKDITESATTESYKICFEHKFITEHI